jgi:radical SAM protein with 4Fe4S-binding SPASM domain
MNKRKLNKALKRISYLPTSRFFFPYAANKVKHLTLNRQKSVEVAYPSTIMLEVTNRCNLHCITCPREYGYGKDMALGKMDYGLLTKIVDQTAPYLDSIGLTGLGEPLLYKKLPEALQYIKSKNKGIITSISSNLMLPNSPSIIAKIAENLDTLQISTDGLGKTYEEIRKSGDFELFDLNLKMISRMSDAEKPDLLFNVVVIKENFKQMSSIVKYAAGLGVSYVNFTYLNLAGIPDIPVEYYDFYKSSEFLTELEKVKHLAEDYPDMELTFWGETGEKSFQACNAPWGHFYITFDGYLVPCCGKPFPKEKHFGNLNDVKVIDALNSDEFKHFRQLWQKNITPKFCRKCNYVV